MWNHKCKNIPRAHWGRKGETIMTTNKSVLAWIDEMKELVQPDKLVWIDGSEEQLEALRAEACSTGEMHKLNQEKLPGCYLHRTAVNDVARVEDRTMICSEKGRGCGPTNHWMDPEKAYKCCMTLPAAATRAALCMSFLIPWVR